MTVTEVRPFANVSGGTDPEGNTTYVNQYHVYTDDKNDGADTVRGPQAVALGLPDYNDAWEWGNDSNPNALAKSRLATLSEVSEEAPFYRKFTIEITYTTKAQERDPSGGSGNREGVQDPLDERPIVRITHIEGSESTDRDKDDNPIQNSAEEPRIVQRPKGFRAVDLTINTSTVSLPIHGNAVFHCNSTEMWGLAVRQVYLAKWDIPIKHRGETPYGHNVMQWWIADPDILWNEVFLDAGSRELIDSNEADPEKRYRKFTGRDADIGQVLLNGAGEKLDLVLNPGQGVIARDFNDLDGFRVIKEFDFLGQMPWLPDPLPGPFV